MNVTVIGCGVIGLTTAVHLQETGFNVRIRTKDLPFDSTSIVAAAMWFPYLAYPKNRVLNWCKESLEAFQKLTDDSATGVRMRPGVDLLRRSDPAPWWQSAVPEVRRCKQGELPPGYRDGYTFTIPVVEMPVYLSYLLQRFYKNGGSVEQRPVASLREALDEGEDIVVNCTGLGARELAEDETVVPIRGQVVRVSNPGLDTVVNDDENPEGDTYIVPRSSDCILGGTAEEARWDTEPDPETAEGILDRCTALEPRLKEAEILEHKVGLRPGRPEIRLEYEKSIHGDTPLIHNYGHGGSGVTISWGCADEVLRLLQESLETNQA